MVNSEPNSKNVKKILNPMESVAKDMYKDTLQNGDRMEISPKSMIMMNSFAELISKIGGGILAIDYGDSFGFSNSLRVFSPKRRESPTTSMYPANLFLNVRGRST